MKNSRISRAMADIRAFLVLDEQKRDRYLVDPQRNFSRRSPLLFSRTVLLVLGLLRKSLSIELFDFFSGLNDEPVSKSAFVQRRQLIKPHYFRDLFVLTADVFYRRFRPKRWKGFRLVAVDGTGFRLPAAPGVGDSFGWHGNQHNRVPSVRALIAFDVLNKIIYDVEHHPREHSEVRINYAWIEDYPADFLTIYDRGFASHAIPLLHRRFGTHCLIRIKHNVSPMVRDFVESADKETIMRVGTHYKARKTVATQGITIQADESVELRLIKVHLPNGDIEVLMTTLLDRKKYKHKHFQKLYQARWGVETAIYCIKSFGQLARMSSVKVDGIEQDIWSQYAMYNLQSMLIAHQQELLQQMDTNRQYPAAINRNVTLGIIKRYLTKIFLDSVRRWKAKLLVLLDRMLNYLESKRPRPSRPRKRKILRGQGRHIHEANYKPAL